MADNHHYDAACETTEIGPSEPCRCDRYNEGRLHQAQTDCPGTVTPDPLLAEAVCRAALMYRGAFEVHGAVLLAGARHALFAELAKWEAQFDA